MINGLMVMSRFRGGNAAVSRFLGRCLRFCRAPLWLLLVVLPAALRGQEDAASVIRIWQTRDRADVLRTRLANDFEDVVAVERLARLFYYDFLDSQGGVRFEDADRWEPDGDGRFDFPKMQPAFEHCADSALWYLLHLWSRSPEEYGYLYYAVVQLEHYLGLDHAAYLLPPEDYYPGKFFPDSYFSCFSLYDWEHNYTIDLLGSMQAAEDLSRNAALRLADLEEEPLYGAALRHGEEVVRVLVLLRDVCRLYVAEHRGGESLLRYKECRTNPRRSIDGRYHASIIRQKEKPVTAAQWQGLDSLLDAAQWDGRSRYDSCMESGDAPVYLVERSSSHGYRAYRTGCPDGLLSQLVDWLKTHVGKVH